VWQGYPTIYCWEELPLASTNCIPLDTQPTGHLCVTYIKGLFFISVDWHSNADDMIGCRNTAQRSEGAPNLNPHANIQSDEHKGSLRTIACELMDKSPCL